MKLGKAARLGPLERLDSKSDSDLCSPRIGGCRGNCAEVCNAIPLIREKKIHEHKNSPDATIR